MKKRNLKSLKLRKNSVAQLGNEAKGGLIKFTRLEPCGGSEIDACPSALACTFNITCQNTFDLTCQTLNNTCDTLNYACQSLFDCQ